jgi:hypothetical protein
VQPYGSDAAGSEGEAAGQRRKRAAASDESADPIESEEGDDQEVPRAVRARPNAGGKAARQAAPSAEEGSGEEEEGADGESDDWDGEG